MMKDRETKKRKEKEKEKEEREQESMPPELSSSLSLFTQGPHFSSRMSCSREAGSSEPQ